MSGTLFDRIAVVDWSASAKPSTGADSIWIATLDLAGLAAGDDAALTLTNPPTRRAALGEIAGLAGNGCRTLVGVDFSLGYPSGTAQGFGLVGTPWRAMWRHLGNEIVDDERNRNNRFAVAGTMNALTGAGPGPFWGTPVGNVTPELSPKKPQLQPGWPAEWRLVEDELRSSGHRPFSSWQLLGAGAVGSQSLVGIAALERLRGNLGRRMAVWPFTTGFTVDFASGETQRDTGSAGEIVIAEVWPSLWDVEVPSGMVKDAAQVEATARRLARLDIDGELQALFQVAVGPDRETVALEEEGWVLGVVPQG